MTDPTHTKLPTTATESSRSIVPKWFVLIGLIFATISVQLVSFTIHVKNTSVWNFAESFQHVTDNFWFFFLSQIDLFAVVIGLLAFAVFKLKSESKWILIGCVLLAHAFLGWFVVFARGEGGLGGTFYP